MSDNSKPNPIETGVEVLCLFSVFAILWTIISQTQKLPMVSKIFLAIVFMLIIGINTFQKMNPDNTKTKTYNEVLFALVLIILMIAAFGSLISSAMITTFGLALLLITKNYYKSDKKDIYYYIPFIAIFIIFNGAGIIYYNFKEKKITNTFL